MKISEYWTKGIIIGWPDICRPNRRKIFPFVQYSLIFSIFTYAWLIWHLVNIRCNSTTQDLYHIIIGIALLLLPSIMNLIFELCRCKYYSNSLHFLGFCKVLSANKKAVVVAEYSIFFSNKFIQIANNHLNIFGRYM